MLLVLTSQKLQLAYFSLPWSRVILNHGFCNIFFFFTLFKNLKKGFRKILSNYNFAIEFWQNLKFTWPKIYNLHIYNHIYISTYLHIYNLQSTIYNLHIEIESKDIHISLYQILFKKVVLVAQHER